MHKIWFVVINPNEDFNGKINTIAMEKEQWTFNFKKIQLIIDKAKVKMNSKFKI